MRMFYAGCAGFILFFLNDLNDLSLHKKWLAACFPLGAALLLASLALQLGAVTPPGGRWLRAAAWCLLAVFTLLEGYTLFFAIPVKASYGQPGQKRRVYTGGGYALCRHPGGLWFAGAMLSLWAAAGLPLWAAAAYTLLDILLVLFEDRVAFPRLLSGYGAYRRGTPFLIPNATGIHRVFGK